MLSLTDIKSWSVEVIPGKLYFYTNKIAPKNNINGAHIVDFDKKYAHKSKEKDFGPINIGLITEYCQVMEYILR